jgi:hypothetical protein
MYVKVTYEDPTLWERKSSIDIPILIPKMVEAFGMLVEENEKYVKIAQELDTTECTEHAILVIPRGCVKDIEEYRDNYKIRGNPNGIKR